MSDPVLFLAEEKENENGRKIETKRACEKTDKCFITGSFYRHAFVRSCRYISNFQVYSDIYQ